jgi:hypothetical protein
MTEEEAQYYRKIIREIQTWLEANEPMEEIVRFAYQDIPSSGSMDHVGYMTRKYNKVAGAVCYHNAIGVQAYTEARYDLRFFKNAIREYEKRKVATCQSVG